jgi:DNA-3-methyladenine glycosylase II
LKHIVNKEDIEILLERDTIFRFIDSKYGPPPGWSRPEGFVSLSRIILEQQVSLSSADAHFRKLSSHIKDFTPEKIMSLSDGEMRNCQISRQKARYLRALASAVTGGVVDLGSLRRLSAEEAKIQLKAIKGIGEWTSDIYLLFCLGEGDIFPVGDIAVLNTVKELTTAVTRDEIVRLSDGWKPLRSLAAFYLWHYYLSKRGRSQQAG